MERQSSKKGSNSNTNDESVSFQKESDSESDNSRNDTDSRSEQELDGGTKKRIGIFDQDSYDLLLNYKQDPKLINDTKVREKIRKIAITFDYEDDKTNEEWPKGKLLYKKFYNRSRKQVIATKLYVPPKHVDSTITFFHSKGNNKHHGWVRTYKLIEEKHAGISQNSVREFIKNCDVCSKFTMVTKKPRLQPILSSGVLDRIQIDLKEYTLYEEDNYGYKYQLTIIDHFSCFPWAIPQFTKTKEETAYNLIQLFFLIGAPRILHSDNGGEFVNSLINQISTVFNITLAHGKAYNPREQGKVEKMNGTIAIVLSKLMYERRTNNWVDLINLALYSIRTTISRATLRTPYEVFYTRKPNHIYDLPDQSNNTDDICLQALTDEHFISLQEAHDDITQAVREQQEANAKRMKAQWDTKYTQKVSIGDYVLIDIRSTKAVQSKRRLGSPTYSHPGTVIRVDASDNIYVHFKNGDVSHKAIWNNKFKVINKEIYDATDYPSDDEEDEDLESLTDNRIENGISRQQDVGESPPLSLCEANENDYDDNNPNEKINESLQIGKPIVGDYVEIYWEGERKWFRCKIVKYLPTTKRYRVIYDDGDVKLEIFEANKWRKSPQATIDNFFSSKGNSKKVNSTTKNLL